MSERALTDAEIERAIGHADELIDDEFYGEPTREDFRNLCIRAKRMAMRKRERAEQAERERDEALEALRPFAEAADILLESRRNNDDWSLWTATYPGGSTSITAAHIREARNVVDHYGGR